VERSRGGQDDPTPPDLSKASGVGFRLSYQPAFDGLRAVAIFLIILYHAYFARPTTHWQFPQISGAFLGVEMFFVQSGFLITALLIGEWEQTRRIRLRNFFTRRFLRLVPALALLLPIVVIWSLHHDGGHVRSFVLGDAAASAAFVQNWRFVATSPRPPLYLDPLWSLSVEGQVYVAIALLLAVLLAHRWTRRHLAPVLALVTCGSAAWMAVLSRGSTPIVRAYAGTDTRAQAFLVGATLAALASSGALFVTARSRQTLRYLVWVAVPVAVGIGATVSWQDRGFYRGGFLAISVCFGAILMYVLQEPHSRLARALSARVLTWPGRMGYGLYIWHFFVIGVLWRPTNDWPFPAALALFTATSLAVASLSWYLLESPILRYARRFRPPKAPRAEEAPALAATGVALGTGPV